ncbi:hypothetical protein Q4595_30290, partial [Wenyingzhuangia sp. 1_MG-2023]|nr:hypothetical protein [Wenyingzhuangia sp. 1_MG-2023]
GEMNPMQLRETTMDPDTRRLVQLVLEEDDPEEEVQQTSETLELMDMLLAKKRAGDRKIWLERRGNEAELA